jgi:hypothetical protein
VCRQQLDGQALSRIHFKLQLRQRSRPKSWSDWHPLSTLKAVPERLRLSWDEADGIMQRAVRRGLARKTNRLPTAIGVDETSDLVADSRSGMRT